MEVSARSWSKRHRNILEGKVWAMTNRLSAAFATLTGWRRIWAALSVVWGLCVFGSATMNEIQDRASADRDSSLLGSSNWAGYTRAIEQLDDPKCLEALARYSHESNARSLGDYHQNCPAVVFRLKMRPPISRQQAIDSLAQARATMAFVTFPGTLIAIILLPSLAVYFLAWALARMSR